jgi:hypothetical protein
MQVLNQLLNSPEIIKAKKIALGSMAMHLAIGIGIYYSNIGFGLVSGNAADAYYLMSMFTHLILHRYIFRAKTGHSLKHHIYQHRLPYYPKAILLSNMTGIIPIIYSLTVSPNSSLFVVGIHIVAASLIFSVYPNKKNLFKHLELGDGKPEKSKLYEMFFN